MKRNTILLIYIFAFCSITATAFSQDTIFSNNPNTEGSWKMSLEKQYTQYEKNDSDNESSWLTQINDTDGASDMKGFYANGNPYYEATIVNDLLQGQYQIWYENGQLAESLFFNDNLENGLARFYYNNGQLAMKGMYYMGKMVGKWEFYNEKGDPFSGWWEWKFAGPMDKIRMSGYVMDGMPMGRWTYQTTGNEGREDQRQFAEDIF